MKIPTFIVKCAMIKCILFRKNNLLYSLNGKTFEIQTLYTGKNECMLAMRNCLDVFLNHWIAQYNAQQEKANKKEGVNADTNETDRV